MLKPLSLALSSVLFAGVATPAWAGKTVDILVLYNSNTLTTRNGSDINARIASYIAYANQAYASSKVDMQLRLVAAQKLDLSISNVSEANLNALRQNASVAQLRRQYGADVVTYLTLSQTVSGGSICGIGFVPNGNSTSGSFYPDSASLAFNLVGVDCHLNVFTHEVGHNMGLGHSYMQNSPGGVYTWGRGHGVMGLFSTVMAYPQSYGTFNQLPIFSNPSLNSCAGTSCGVERTRLDGADAAASLNALASQITEFLPTVVPLAGASSSSTSSSSGGTLIGSSTSSSSSSSSSSSGQTIAQCVRTLPANTLIKNGEFANLDGWISGLGASTLALSSVANGSCADNVLAVKNRKSYLGDAFYPLQAPLVAGSKYLLTARASVRNSARDNMRVAVVINTSAGKQLYELPTVSLTPNEFTQYKAEFTAPTSGINGVLLFGPQANVDLLLDGVALTPVAAAAPPVNTTLINEGFESASNGWSAVFGGKASIVSTSPAEGKFCLQISGRTSINSGASVQLGAQLQGGKSYGLNAKLRVGSSTGKSALTQLWLIYNDSRGAQKINLGSVAMPTGVWTALTANFNVFSVGAITSAQIVVSGPAVAQDIFVDAVKLSAK